MQLGFVCLENTDSVPEAIVDRQFIGRLSAGKAACGTARQTQLAADRKDVS